LRGVNGGSLGWQCCGTAGPARNLFSRHDVGALTPY
jgi:hypothetical protein